MIKKVKNLLNDLFHLSPFNADKPYVVKPPEQDTATPPNNDEKFFQETSIDVQTIEGTPISFGTEEKKVVDESGNATSIIRTQGHILGTGILVTNLHPTAENGISLPGVGGVCSICKKEAAVLLEANLIDIDEAHRRSLFDTNSRGHCDECGRQDLCIRHCRPFQKDDETQVNLCPDCSKAAQHKKWTSTALNILCLPFIDTKSLPPESKEENSRE